MPPGSEPASGSDSAKAGDHSPLAQRGRKRCLSSSVPNRRIGSVPSSWTIRISAVEAHALATSSIAMLSISVPVPVPPYSSSNGSPSRSCSANSLRRSHGYSALASISAARGRDPLAHDLADRVAEGHMVVGERVRGVSRGARGHGWSVEHPSEGVSADRPNGQPRGEPLRRRTTCGHRHQHLPDRRSARSCTSRSTWTSPVWRSRPSA